ncbi:MAG: biotin/lipoyl-containing protein, partial [Bacteroidota bacterium]
MARIDIIIPAMGEGVTEATITRWMVKEGDFIDEDTPVVEIATDKVDSEITAPAAGYLKKIVRNEGEIPKIGDTIGIMVSEKNESTSDEKLIVKTETDANILRPEKEEQKETQKTQHASISYQADDSIESKKTGFISPLVKKMATEMNISPNELSSIKGTSSSGRITRDDFYNYLKNKKSGVRQEISQKEEEPAFLSRNQIYGSDDNRVEKMSRTRQLIAKHMNYSVKTSAHVTSFHEADVTNLVKWREKNKND